MKIYSSAPDGNEAADMANNKFFKLAIQEINNSNERLKETDSPIQMMLAYIDILLLLCRKFPKDANLDLEIEKIKEWRETFFTWYDRCNKKIPAKFREGIKESAETLFDELSNYGH